MPKDPCSELSRTITQLAMTIGERPEVKNLDDVLAQIQKEIPELGRAELVASINEATTGAKRAKDELKAKLADLRREARNDQAVRAATVDLERRLKAGQGPPTPQARKPAPAAIQTLRAERDKIRAELDKTASTPAERQRIKDRIAELDRHIAAGTVPPARERPVPPADIAALRAERDAKYRQAQLASPARRNALEREIAELDAHLKAGTVPPKAAAPKPPPADIAALRQKRDELRAQVERADPAKQQAIRDQIAALEQNIAEGSRPLRETKADNTPADLKALRDERDALKRRMDQEDAARARIATLEKHLKDGTLPAPTDPAKAPVDPAVAGLRAQADALQSALRNSEPALRQKFEAQIADLTQRLELGVEAPEPKADLILSKELERLAYQRDRLRGQIRMQIEGMKPKGWWKRYGSEALNLQRAFFTSLDVSAIGRQGGWVGFGHPIQHARIMKQSFAAMRDPERAHAINAEIMNRPNAPLYARSKLYIAPEHGGMSGSEEAFMSRLAHKVPGLAASERQYTTFLNVLRADMFDSMAATLARNGEPTLAEAQHIANYVNIATGRGSLAFKGLDNAADALATTFFSPRYMASRIQMAVGQPLWGAGGGTWRTRKLIAKEYGRSMAGLAAVLGVGMLAGGTVETDPRSSDFLKLRFGDRRIDFTSGIAQYITLGSRLATGKTKDKNGRIKKDDPDRTAWYFLRGKLAPVPGAAWSAIKGKDMAGEDTTAAREVANLMVPITPREVYRSMREDGVPDATIDSILNFFGLSASSYK